MASVICRCNRQLSFIPLAILIISFSSCEKALNLKAPASGPVAVFNEVWKVMDQRYAMFTFKGADWTTTYQKYSALVNDDMSSAELFRVIADMLETLHDGHVTLISGSDTATYDNFYKGYSTNFNFENIRLNYLANDFRSAGNLIYKITDNTGYIYYPSFDSEITGQDLDHVFSDLAQTKGLIVDVRNNKGGSSEQVIQLFAHFVPANKLVKYNLFKNGSAHDDFFAPTPVYVTPAGQFIYDRPVIVLTNRACFSACNDFASYMADLPNVQLYGDQTGGGGGIPANYLLANGWMLQYSSTQTLSPAKENIENGIQPDVRIGISSIDETNGRDPILEKAFRDIQ